MRADKQCYPLLLSNGNLLAQTTLPNGRHEALWEDPQLKPCYLFAVVAGNFDCREQTVQTASGRQALLQVYSDQGSQNKTAWALDCLIRSVQWDERRFGLELDLDRFMIVAACASSARRGERLIRRYCWAWTPGRRAGSMTADRKSTRLNSSH